METLMEYTLEEFRLLCKQHDWTFEYSDDHRYWKRGSEQQEKLFAIIKEGGDAYADVYDEEMPDILK